MSANGRPYASVTNWRIRFSVWGKHSVRALYVFDADVSLSANRSGCVPMVLCSRMRTVRWWFCEGVISGWDVSHRDSRPPRFEYEMHGRITFIEHFPAHLEREAVFLGEAVGSFVFLPSLGLCFCIYLGLK